MKERDIILRLLAIPRDFSTTGSRSISDLLMDTGYCQVYDSITECAIETALSDTPDLVSDWLAYSEDKRTSSGWYFKKVKDGVFAVGKIGVGVHEDRTSTYSSMATACAAFIKREVETIRESVCSTNAAACQGRKK